MNASIASETRPDRLRTRNVVTLTLVWALAVLLVFAWQTFEYRGIVAVLAEWQFATFREFYPLATICLLTLLLTLPLLVVLIWRVRTKRTLALLQQEPEAIVERARYAFRDLVVASVVIAIAAAVVAIYGFSIGRFIDKPRNVQVQELRWNDPGEGPVIVHGVLRSDRIGIYNQDAILLHRDLRVAPIVPRNSAVNAIRFFAQVDLDKAEPARNVAMSGYLRKESLPGALERVFVNAGFRVAGTHYVLFRSIEEVRSPYFIAARNLGVLALVLALFAYLEFRWKKRVGNETRKVSAATI